MNPLFFYYARILGIIVVAAVLCGLGIAYAQAGFSTTATLNGALDGSIIGFLLGSYTLCSITVFKQAAMRFPFLVVLIWNSFVYVVLILVGRGLGRYAAGATPTLEILPNDSYLINTVVSAFGASVVLNFLFQITRIVGFRQLVAFISGRFHVPILVERTFVLIDLAGSTSIAERIGERRFLSFIDDFFHSLTANIILSRAEIYKYVGDEVILTWPAAHSDRAVDFLQSSRRTLERRADFFQRKYGFVPEYRAAAHTGTVIAGELGDIKKEIAYMGDVLNTASRLLEESKKLGCMMVISKDTVTMLERPRTTIVSMGLQSIRGREKELEVFRVD